MFKKVVMAATLSAAAAAHADTFFFEYSFINESRYVHGYFDGTQNGDLVTGLSNISVAVNNYLFPGNGSLYGSSWGGNDWVSGGAVASFSGALNNFLFIDVDYPTSTSFSSYFLSVDSRYKGLPFINVFSAAGNAESWFNDYKWRLTNVSAVPEPETYAMMLAGLGVIGAMARRRKAKLTA